MTDCLISGRDAACEVSTAGQYADVPAAQYQQGAQKEGDSNKSKDIDFLRGFELTYEEAGLIPPRPAEPGSTAADVSTQTTHPGAADDAATLREALTPPPPYPGLENAGAALGADGRKITTAASGPAMCTDLNDLENCPVVLPGELQPFEPGPRPPHTGPTFAPTGRPVPAEPGPRPPHTGPTFAPTGRPVPAEPGPRTPHTGGNSYPSNSENMPREQRREARRA